MRALARRAQHPLVNYGEWDEEKIALAQAHDLVILDPNERGLGRETIARIQGGTDPDDPCKRVIVLCYISIGEDQRTATVSDEVLRPDPRFRGDGTGPRVDPRGPFADGKSLTGVAPLGKPSPGGTGYASYYLDDVSVRNDPNHLGDGRPDRNGNFNAAFVNAGDPKWFDALQDMLWEGEDKLTGLREILTTT